MDNAELTSEPATPPTDRIAYVAAWASENRDKIIAAQARYRESKRDELRAKSRAYAKQRRLSPHIRRSQYLRERLRRHAMGRTVGNSDIERLTGLDTQEFRTHLESQFRHGMSWSNYATLWELDHVAPVRSFDCSIPAQAAACFHYTNIRPWPISKNRRRGQGRENYA